MSRSIWRIVTALFFIFAGMNHFRRPQMYLRIMPPGFSHPMELVWISGLFEMIGGIGLFFPLLRRPACWGLMLLLIAIFPANIYMAISADRFVDLHVPRAVLWGRLLLQPILIFWVWWVAQ